MNIFGENCVSYDYVYYIKSWFSYIPYFECFIFAVLHWKSDMKIHLKYMNYINANQNNYADSSALA